MKRSSNLANFYVVLLLLILVLFSAKLILLVPLVPLHLQVYHRSHIVFLLAFCLLTQCSLLMTVRQSSQTAFFSNAFD